MAKAKSGDTVAIRLVAHGENSAVTGGKTLRKGDTADVAKDVAAAAVQSGRWEFVEAPKASEGGGGEGA